MHITKKLVRELVEILEGLKGEMYPKEKAKYPFSEWERKRERVKQRLSRLPELVKRSVAMLPA